MRNCRLPPTFIPVTPSSQPLITWCAPIRNWNAGPPTELSNFFPLVSHPVYWTFTVFPRSAAFPVPTLMSQYCRPEDVLVPSPVTLVGPPAAGACDLVACP